MANSSRYRDQLESLYGISAQIARLRDLTEVYDLALTFCLALTASEMGLSISSTRATSTWTSSQ